MPDLGATPLALHAWLRAATDGLCDEAKAFLYPSIEAHFANAVADSLAQGQSQPQAEAAALAAMGSANAARAQLQRTFLTPPEAARFGKLLLDLRKPVLAGPALGSALVFSGLVYICWLLMNTHTHLHPLTVMMFGVCISFLYTGLARHFARLWPERRSLRFVLLARGLLKAVLIFAFSVFFCKTADVSDWFYLIVIYVSFRNALRPWQDFRLWLAVMAKLGRNPRLAEDFEPRPAEPRTPALKGVTDHA